MKWKESVLGLAAFVWLASVTPAAGWGLATHRWISDEALAVTAEPLRRWLAEHRRKLSDRAVEPDTVLRKRDGRRESVRHFINLDSYGPPPFTALPRDRGAAEKRFGRKVVENRGTLPWTIVEMHDRLATELRRGRWKAALRTAGLAGHYVADAFMPLHATENHDGQKSGQHGIHARIERDLVNPRLDRYAKRALAVPLPKPERVDTRRVFEVLLDSYDLVSPLLRADELARAEDLDVHLERLDRRIGMLLAKRLGEARGFLARFWESAWEAAGRPSLPRTSP